MEITILCPFHGKEEKVTLPSMYMGGGFGGVKAFEGDIPCGAVDPQRRIHVVLHIRVNFSGAVLPWIEKLEYHPSS